jgi:uncharacterized membrane protein
MRGNRTSQRQRRLAIVEHRRPPLLKSIGLTGLSAGTGAVVEYLFDPDRGRARRAKVRDQAAHAAHEMNDSVGGLTRDLSNRGRGVAAGARYRFTGRSVDDPVLHERVRAELGRHVRHPHAIDVRVRDGVVTLAGDILSDEEARAIRAVRRVPGVKKIDTQWRVHDDATGVPQLQGDGRRQPVPELLQQHWSPAARFLTGTGAVAGWAVSRRLPPPLAWTVRGASSVLGARAATNLPLRRLTGITAGRRGVDVRGAITVSATPEKVWKLVSDYSVFPRIMPDVREVRRSDDGRLSHWVVKGPAGTSVGYDAEETRREDGREIAWKTTDGQLTAHTGRLRLDPMGDGRTRVQLEMTYRPAGGAIGHAVAALLGADPARMVKRSLQRLKSFIETGRPSDAAQPAGTADIRR